MVGLLSHVMTPFRLDTGCLPLGVDTALFNERRAAMEFPDAINILIVGSLVPVKGHAMALHAIQAVSRTHPDVHLHFIGDGILRQSLQEMAGDLGLGPRITFHGHVEHDLLPAYYRAADFCLLSSLFETSAVVVFEAAACGRITIGSSVGSLAEVTPEEYRTVPGDAAALAGTINRLIGTSDEWQELGQQVRDRVLRAYTHEHMIERYSGAYERLSAIKS